MRGDVDLAKMTQLEVLDKCCSQVLLSSAALKCCSQVLPSNAALLSLGLLLFCCGVPGFARSDYARGCVCACGSVCDRIKDSVSITHAEWLSRRLHRLNSCRR